MVRRWRRAEIENPEYHKTPLGVAGLLCVLGLLFLVGGGGRLPAQLWWLPALSALIEIAAFRLPGWGFVSTSPALYLACLLHPELGPAVAGLLSLTLLSFRSLLRSGAYPRALILELVTDLVPLYGLLITIELTKNVAFAWVFGYAIYVIVWSWLPRLLTRYPRPLWLKTRLRAAPFILGAFPLGYLLTEVSDGATLFGLALALAGFSYGAGLAASFELSLEQKLLSLKLWQQQRARERLESAIAEYKSSSANQGQIKKLLEATASKLEQAHTSEVALQRLLELCDSISPNDQVLFLEPEQTALRAKLGTDQAAIVLCEQAWREDSTRAANRENFHELATPLPGYGVVYLHRQKPPYRSAEIEQLELMLRQASVMLTKLVERESSQKSLAFITEERRLLSRWVFRLRKLLEFSRDTLTARESEQILSQTRETLRALIPHEAVFLARPTEKGDFVGAPQQLASQLREASDHGPRLFEQFRFGEDIVSLMVVPMPTAAKGLWALQSRGRHPFEPEQLDLMGLVVRQTAFALDNLELTQRYLEASKLAGLGSMAAGLAHELNTPLGAIQLALESFQTLQQKDPEKAQQRLRAAEESVRAANDIVETLLFFTTSYGVDDTLPVELTGLLRREAERAGGSYAGDVDSLEIQGHELDLEQMVRQLLNNARQACKKSFGAELKDEPATAIIRVWDDGPGVEPEIRERIFEPFFTTRPPGQGLGLGLCVARRVAELHGGSLRLLDQAGQNCFEVRLKWKDGG